MLIVRCENWNGRQEILGPFSNLEQANEWMQRDIDNVLDNYRWKGKKLEIKEIKNGFSIDGYGKWEIFA